jgi:putative phosphoribosyl transferase
LHLVQAPTLLIIGGDDRPVISLNEIAYAKLRAPKELIIVPKASHLFEEPGALDRVAELARDWFMRFFLSPTRKIEKKGVDGYTLEKGGI